MYSSYSSGYSRAPKFNLQAQKKMKQRQKGKSCGYYMRIIFFFSSLIQSLIIVSLVLFLVYGKQADSASAMRIQDLERSFNKLSMENVDLRQHKTNLTQVLNVTVTEKIWNDRALFQLRYLANTSYTMLRDLNAKLTQCNLELQRRQPTSPSHCPRTPMMSPYGVGTDKNCEMRLQMVQSNFTQTFQMARMEMEQVTKERDNFNLDAIRLRKEKATVEKELADYRVKCKEDFAQSLSGISNVSRAFLSKIDSLFPHHIPFQLTCMKQRENLEQIRNNCTSLSREVEDKFQRYLNNVGAQVSRIQQENSRLTAENFRLREDHIWCSKNRSSLIQEHGLNAQKLQLKCDQAKERLLVEKKRLTGDKELQGISLKMKDGEIQYLKDQLKQLNASCAHKAVSPGGSGTGTFGTGGQGQAVSSWNKLWGSSSSSSFGKTGSSSNKPVSNPSTGLSFGSTGSNTGTGLGSNKPSFGSTGSNSGTGLGSNKPSSSKPSTGSSVWSILGSNKAVSNRSSSTSTGLGSSKLSTSSSGSTGLGAGKNPSSGLGSTGVGSSSSGSTRVGSTGGTGGSGSTGKTGTGTGLGSSSSTGQGGTGTGSTGLGNRGGTGLGGTGTSSLGNRGSTGQQMSYNTSRSYSGMPTLKESQKIRNKISPGCLVVNPSLRKSCGENWIIPVFRFICNTCQANISYVDTCIFYYTCNIP